MCTTSLESELLIDVINSFQILVSGLDSLNKLIQITDQSLPGWFVDPPGLEFKQQITYRNKTAIFLNQLEYLDWQDPRAILLGVGIFAASTSTIAQINRVNRYKEQFKAAILAVKINKLPLKNPILNQRIGEILKLRPQYLTNQLQKIGLARLHLKQCYRKIPILMQKPSKVSWTWANTRAINKISVAQAYELLLKQNLDLGIQQQLNSLNSLSSNTPLAIVQDLAPHLRANIVTVNSDQTNTRKMIKGAVPIFYLSDATDQLPEIIPPKTKHTRDSNRLVRKDLKINPIPFLPAIRAHRYI